MVRRTTVELDEELVGQAKRALQMNTTRGVIEEALRRVVLEAGTELEDRRTRQLRFFAGVSGRLDTELLASDEMWR